jgi:hypothetical protein
MWPTIRDTLGRHPFRLAAFQWIGGEDVEPRGELVELQRCLAEPLAVARGGDHDAVAAVLAALSLL